MIDLGGLASGGRLQQFPIGTLPTLSLVKLGEIVNEIIVRPTAGTQ